MHSYPVEVPLGHGDGQPLPGAGGRGVEELDLLGDGLEGVRVELDAGDAVQQLDGKAVGAGHLVARDAEGEAGLVGGAEAASNTFEERKKDICLNVDSIVRSRVTPFSKVPSL